MRSPSPRAGKFSAREICVLALMGALIFATKMALVSLPNVNMNSVLIILTTVFFGWNALFSVAIYIMLEGLVFGFGMWWFCYWYLWPALVAVTMLLRRRNGSAVVWAVVAGTFGLCFGALCSIPYLFIGGRHMAFAMWIAGIPYDLVHCVGNFVFALVLYTPLHKALALLLKRSPRT